MILRYACTVVRISESLANSCLLLIFCVVLAAGQDNWHVCESSFTEGHAFDVLAS